MPKEMWFPIVGFLYSAGEASKPELYDFLVKTGQLEYLYLKDPNEELDYEVTWDIATKLENLDLETDEKMRDCENFKKLLDLLPLLENLFNKIDLPFIEEAINQEYEKDFIIVSYI